MTRLRILSIALAGCAMTFVAVHWPQAPEPVYAMMPPHSAPEEWPGLIAEYEGELQLLLANYPPVVPATKPPRWIVALPRPLAWWARCVVQPAEAARIKRKRDYDATLNGLEAWLNVKLGDEAYRSNVVARHNVCLMQQWQVSYFR